MEPSTLIRVFLCGDVMTGRGIDQVLPCPSAPSLHEPYIRDAREYVKLAEAVSGPIPRAVELPYIWGEMLAVLGREPVDVRIINLETSITRSETYWRGKEIHYRMHPSNAGCLSAAQIDCCCLANNHVLDWGYDGLVETLRTLEAAGIAYAGAGRNLREAAAPAVLKLPGKGRVLVFACGLPTSGIPLEWAARSDRPGVNLITDTSVETARRMGSEMRRYQREGDVMIVSIHWGGNWGYHLRDEEIRFAHHLADEGVAVVHGHSSHHVKTAEIYRDRLVLYGCGDFLNDYEGISGFEDFRSNLTLMYLATLNPKNGQIVETKLVPMTIEQFKLKRASAADTRWLCDLLTRLGTPMGTSAKLMSDGNLVLEKAR